MVRLEGLDVLFFDLASESRLAILQELSKISLKMQDIARKLDLTATEASRQLQRMSKARLIERLPEGTYTTTHSGKLILTLASPMSFAFKHRDYFLEHNVWHFPIDFVHRLGELSQGVLVSDLNENMIRWEEMIKAAEDHVRVMTPQVMPTLSRIMGEKLQAGVKLKSLLSDQLSTTSKTYAQTGQNVERKLFPSIPAIIIATEKEATISLPFLNGQMYHAAFFGNDEQFLKWVNDLFLYYWNQGKIFTN